MSVVEVAAGLIRRDDELLVCQRSLAGRHPGKFEFPGGKRELGETIEECLRRELHEELAVVVEVGLPLWRTRHEYAEGAALELIFLAVRSVAGTLSNQVFESIGWTPLADLERVDFLDGDRELVAMVRRGDIDVPPTEFR